MDPRGSMSSDVQENSTSQSRRSAYLTTNHNDYSHLPFRDQPSLAQIRRVEDYIEGNWDQPQSIDALSVIVGVSARSLFQYFQKKRGYSPMVSSWSEGVPLLMVWLEVRVFPGRPNSRFKDRRSLAVL
jgi:AraC-like DNA-binding protein